MNSASLDLDTHDIVDTGKSSSSLLTLAKTIAVLILCEFTLATLNDYDPSNAWAVLAFAGFLLFLYQFCASAPASVIVFLPMLIIRTTEIGSCVAIESGAFMHEITQTGHPTGGTARLAIVLMTFFGVGALIVEPVWLRYQAQSDNEQPENSIARLALPITIVCLVGYAYFFYIGLRFGLPLFSGSDRFDFRYRVADPIYSSLSGNRHLFVAAISLLATDPRTRLRAWGLFLAIFFISILFGEKFGPLVVMSAIFPAAPLLVYLRRKKQLPLLQMMSIGIALGAMTLGICLTVYSLLYNDLETAKTKLVDRMAEQGEMWYVGDRDFRYNKNIDWRTISQDISACLGQRSQDPQDIGTDFGPFHVMQSYADKYYLANGQEKGIYFAFTYSTYWLMVSGYGGFALVSFLTSIAYGIAGRFLLLGLIDRNVLGVLLSQKAILLVQTALITGFTLYVFGYKTIGIFCAAWLVVYWRHLFSIRPLQRLNN